MRNKIHFLQWWFGELFASIYLIPVSILGFMIYGAVNVLFFFRDLRRKF